MEDRMTPAEHATWSQRRQMGRWRYLLRHGIIGKGLRFGVLMAAVQWAWLSGHGQHLPPAEWAVRFAWMAVMYGGIIGWLDWGTAEDRYAEGPESDELEPEITCLKCEAVIPAGEHRCLTCGWSFDDEGAKPDVHDAAVPAPPGADL